MKRAALALVALTACASSPAGGEPGVCREAVEHSVELLGEMRDYLAVGVPAALASQSMVELEAWEAEHRPLAEAWGHAAAECLEES